MIAKIEICTVTQRNEKGKYTSYLLNVNCKYVVIWPFFLWCGHDGLHGATAAAATTPSLIS
jgi:hypothetical protein